MRPSWKTSEISRVRIDMETLINQIDLYIHTHIHTHMHAHIQKHTHTNIHTIFSPDISAGPLDPLGSALNPNTTAWSWYLPGVVCVRGVYR